MPTAIVAGGGLAGMSAAIALADAGFDVTLFEMRAFLGGRATSFPVTPTDSNSEIIDNCQHVLLACFTNLLDFYERLGVGNRIEFHSEFYFVEPGGRVSSLRSGALPAPLHSLGSFLRLPFLGARDKLGIARAMGALARERKTRTDLDRITMLDWLREKKQTGPAIERFWRQVLVSAVNEELDRMAARHGFQVFSLGFMQSAENSRMGLAAVPLSELYGSEAWEKIPNVTIRFRTPIERFAIENGSVTAALSNAGTHTADYYVSAVPFEKIGGIAPALGLDLSAFEHSPITGIHLWFDRPVTGLPQATLLDRTMQWMFNKREGAYLQLVVSASRSLLEMPRKEVIDLAVRELAEFFPEVKTARLEKAHVIKEARATFSAAPGVDAMRPEARTKIPNLFLAGDWTRTGWPATMEGAVRSGYLAAEAIAAASGKPRSFVIG
jgi:zeta-carotene desaturase